MTTLDEALAHYGVPGMKWGVRRSGSSKTSSKKKSTVSSDAKKAKEIKKKKGKKVESLSNKELKELNERLQLEQNYKRLNPSVVQSGRAKAQAVVATVGLGVTVYNMATSPAAKALVNTGKKVVG